MSDESEQSRWQRLYRFTFERCLHNPGTGHDRWLICWRCALAWFDAETARLTPAAPSLGPTPCLPHGDDPCQYHTRAIQTSPRRALQTVIGPLDDKPHTLIPKPASPSGGATGCAWWCGDEYGPTTEFWKGKRTWCSKGCMDAGKPLHPAPPKEPTR